MIFYTAYCGRKVGQVSFTLLSAWKILLMGDWYVCEPWLIDCIWLKAAGGPLWAYVALPYMGAFTSYYFYSNGASWRFVCEPWWAHCLYKVAAYVSTLTRTRETNSNNRACNEELNRQFIIIKRHFTLIEWQVWKSALEVPQMVHV